MPETTWSTVRMATTSLSAVTVTTRCGVRRGTTDCLAVLATTSWRGVTGTTESLAASTTTLSTEMPETTSWSVEVGTISFSVARDGTSCWGATAATRYFDKWETISSLQVPLRTTATSPPSKESSPN